MKTHEFNWYGITCAALTAIRRGGLTEPERVEARLIFLEEGVAHFQNVCNNEVMNSAATLKPLAQTYEFTNERDAVRFARSRDRASIHIHVERISRGRWLVDISSK